MSKYDRLKGEQALPFDEGERAENDARKESAAMVRRRGKPGPDPSPDSLRAQAEDGRASHLHALVPKDLHQRLKMRSVTTERAVSLIVADAIREYLERTER